MSEGNGRRGGGPVHKLTPEVHRIVVEAIGKGMPREFAARLAKVCPATLYRWLKIGRRAEAGPERELLDAIKHAESACMDHCLTVINEHSITHWQAAAWLMERRHSRYFGRKVDVGERLEKVLAELEKARDAQLG